MNNARLTFNTSTNFILPIGVYNVLGRDAYCFGYIKNDMPNISGFLNKLLPALSDQQEELYKELLEYNKGDREKAKDAIRGIYNVYLSRFSYFDDGVTNVPFRINKENYDDFITIHDKRLSFYDTDFTNYVRSLLIEYCSKKAAHRESMFLYRMLKPMAAGGDKRRLCKIYHADGDDIMFPISVEESPVYDRSYIVGVTRESNPIAIKLYDVRRIVWYDEKIKITSDHADEVLEYLKKIYDGEADECSD